MASACEGYNHGMGDLVTGTFADDGGISHAVDEDNPDASLCGKPDPGIGDPSVAWELAPVPKCQRCQAVQGEPFQGLWAET